MDWIEKRIHEAQNASPISDAVASLLEARLEGVMHERTLHSAELNEIAGKLITATDSVENEAES
jgi:hypothetical protein